MASRGASGRKAMAQGAIGQAAEKAVRGEEMRIVGGEFRGRPLATPRSQSIRPTTDRTREAVFNVLAHRFPEKLEGARVLDLFAGTGALGLEALSRGAAHCLFIEESAEGRGLIRTNVEAFGLQGRTKIFRRDATGLGDAGTIAPFGLLFADPPYGKGLGETALRSAPARRLAAAWRALRRRGVRVGALRPGRGIFRARRTRLWRHGDPLHRGVRRALRLGIALNSASFAAQMTNN